MADSSAQGTECVGEHGEEGAIRRAQAGRSGLLALEEAELLAEQGDLQILGPLRAAAPGEQVEEEGKDVSGE
jgi:hypothetical protein